MIIQPRRGLLEIWGATVRCSLREGGWVNPGCDGSGSISDAEQLICLLYPAFKVKGLGFSEPDATERDVHEALAPLGGWETAPTALAEIIGRYLDTYSAQDGRPVFPAGGCLRPLERGAEPSPEQARLETVEAFSMAVTFSLSALAFVKSFAAHVRGARLTASLRETEAALDRRLTHAMRGLLASFCVDVFPADSAKGETLVRTLTQKRQPPGVLLDQLAGELGPVRAGLRGLPLPASVAPRLADEALLFQCGWSWGPVRADDDQPPNVADPVPSLYFTVTAMDGIVDLFSRQTLLRGLLSPEQHGLAHELQRRWELAQGYWTSLARFGGARWPLQDMPWRTAESEESEYATLQVASVVVHNLMRRHDLDDVAPVDDLTPLADVLVELAARGGITRRPSARGRTAELHVPGELLALPGSERGGPALGRLVSDYAPMLLKRVLQVAGLTPDLRQRDRLLSVADELADHLWGRRLNRGPAADLWDVPGAAYGRPDPQPAKPSWYLTERVMEVLVVAATMVGRTPARSPLLSETAGELLREAEHLFAQELMSRPVEPGSPD
ncbi:SCO2524 family protein, partial [Streptomyces carpinensis]